MKGSQLSKPNPIFFVLITGLLALGSFTVNVGTTADDLSPVRTPEQEMATFQTEPGLKIQLVAAEPMVQDPVTMTFDADGRLWVVEMPGYMANIDGTGEEKPTGRVSVLEDRNGDGLMDVSTIYLDSLVMPRAIALVPGGALVAENGMLWFTKDTNSDGKADSKTLIDKNYTGGGLPEHAPNALWQSMDNWIYNAKSKQRYKLVNGTWLRDSTEFRGQWGMSHDDKGRLVYNYNWSQLHADLVPPNTLSRNKHHMPTTGIDHGLTIDRRIYPIRPTPAVNRGYIAGTLDKEGRLLEFTAACSPFVYRETALPTPFAGNIFVCEPAGNLIKRNVVAEKNAILTASDPHPGREFWASTDERFRPVSLATGPDGALYVADMYRGIVQHKAYMTPYLKEQTLSRKLDMPVHTGRIWRVVPQNWTAPTPKKLSQASATELIQELSSADGWHRDMAQQLLVGRNEVGAKKELETVALIGKTQLGRFHALWTLDGLKLSDANLLLGLVSDPNPLVQGTALRLLEPLAKADKAVQAKMGKQLLLAVTKAPTESMLQMALSAQALDPATSHKLLATIVERQGGTPLIRDAVLSSLQDGEMAFLRQLWAAPGWQTREPSKEIFVEMLASAIVRKRDPNELGPLFAMLNNTKPPLAWRTKAVLSGLAIGGSGSKQKPIKLATAPQLLTQQNGLVEASRLATLTSLFEWPGHSVEQGAVAKKNVLSDEDQKLFANGRQLYLSTCSGCHGTDGVGVARFAPPLIGSDWVTGDGKRLALILLHGMEGPVDVAGKVYNKPEILPVMPAHSTMDDASITAILTYIRNEWGNQAGPIPRRTVGMTRIMAQGRVAPWTAAELNKYMADTQSKEGAGNDQSPKPGKPNDR